MPRCPNPRCSTDYAPGTVKCLKPNCQCLLPDAVIAGRYRIETLLGLGGMGAVYRASDTFEMQQVALKVILAAGRNMNEATAIERFRREARYAHQLKHKNIVPVLNFGQDGEQLYLVMPLVTGGTLKNLLKAEKPLPLPLVQRYLRDLTEAVDAIHMHPQKIVHRDIKPSNLLIHQDDGRLVVADFGIARAMQKERPLTQSGWALGSEHYTAPEQVHGQPEPSSDMYSIGVVAYQMLTGLLPFQAIVRTHAVALPCPSELNKELPSSLDDVIFRAMDNDPLRRYATGSEFIQALEASLQGVSSASAGEGVTLLDTAEGGNIIVRTIVPENPCSVCGQENRSSSRFCRRCGERLDATSPMVTEVCQVGYVSDRGREHMAGTGEDMLLLVQGLCANFTPPPRPFGLFAVADGLRGASGRAAGGREASRLVIETLADVLVPLLATPLPSMTATPWFGAGSALVRGGLDYRSAALPDTTIEQWMREGMRRATLVLFHCNADYDASMVSTLSTALIHKRRLYIANVGDSRIYRYRPTSGLRCLTTDEYMLPVEQIETSLLVPVPADKGEVKQQRSPRVLGQTSQVQLDYIEYEMEPNDLILLCSNGLWHTVQDDRLKELLARGGDPQKLARALADEAKLKGNAENISIILIRVL